ncbi:sulfoxide reductase heme-binding subunit YedZ [Colwellia chukchiensis]|uniref:Protein-methionine-sulfoxide reductase heme-binding subunit MsrQ n=1 Tax=Colwellia chukchiensis TaxID=641665 RepID=A0A1H7HM99_9GAMM|nr:protein-methionine-sulfoxide reductase heme-binding subunit MsrQ [Colwellia chukchiensis]SEK51391.1 sulfoxide reductase heme-binding subunit YedZ [Colwellia chukchiensis]
MSSDAKNTAIFTVKAQRLRRRVWLLKLVIHCAALLPLLAIYSLAFADQLGADPVKAVMHFTGIGGFNLLLLTLTVTPLAKTFRAGYLLKVRRLLGLYSFSYGLCHVLSFLAFEVQFDWRLFVAEIIDRPYITIGMTAFTILLALAITSVSALQNKLGKNWQKLHNFVYVAALLIAWHFYWSVKSNIVEPLIYLLMVLVLLSLRKQKISRWLR